MSETRDDSIRATVANALEGLWWFPVLRGICLVILGLFALLRPGMTIEFLATLLGIFVILDGLLSVFAGVAGHVPSRFWTIVRGVVAVLIGMFVVAHPMLMAAVTATVLLYLLAATAVVSGILEISGAIQDRKHIEGEGWLVLGGVLSIVFGVLLFAAPLGFGLLLVRILGVYAILFGIGLFVFAYRICRLARKVAG
jgi:uncharacterized membrane protein HdeD (DUF308 family)